MLDKKKITERNAFGILLQLCLKIDPDYDEIKYICCGADFATSFQEVQETIDEFKRSISKIPLIAVILVWASQLEDSRIFSSRHIEMMIDLIEKKFLIYEPPQEERLLTFGELVDWDKSVAGHLSIIESIRCYRDWSFEKRENYVNFYITFANWLSQETFGYFPKACDRDRDITARRQLKFELYIKILSHLSLRERTLAKILFLGNVKSLEEALSLKIEDIYFENHALKLSEKLINYPDHVLEDLKEYIDSRNEGFVFVDLQDIQLDHTAPNRALKTVINKLDLDSSFSFKDFVKDL